MTVKVSGIKFKAELAAGGGLAWPGLQLGTGLYGVERSSGGGGGGGGGGPTLGVIQPEENLPVIVVLVDWREKMRRLVILTLLFLSCLLSLGSAVSGENIKYFNQFLFQPPILCRFSAA